MTNLVAQQTLFPFATVENEATAPVASSLPARLVPPAEHNCAIKLIAADPNRIMFHPAFRGADEMLARRYGKDVAAVAGRMRSGDEQAPFAVYPCDEDGSYVLIGHPAGLLAARAMRADDPAFRVMVMVRPRPEPAAYYASLTTALRRPSDWERYMVAHYHVQSTGSARAALGLLGLDPVKKESGFSRLLSVGKLLAAFPQLDPLTVSANAAARVMTLRSHPDARTTMDWLIEEATNAATELLDARKLLPQLIAAADPTTVTPVMLPIASEPDAWTFQRPGDPSLARVTLVDQVWSAQFLQPMDAVTWRGFGKAIAALMR